MKPLKDRALDLLARCQIVTFASLDEAGFPRPVPVVKVKTDDRFTVWFATGINSEKVRHIRKSPKAGLSFYEQGDSVGLTGHAEVFDDAATRHGMWQEWFIKHFPGGMDDPEYCLIRFTADEGIFYVDEEFAKEKI